MTKSFFYKYLVLASVTTGILSACNQKTKAVQADALEQPVLTTLPFTELKLNDLSSFEPTGKNWRVVGDVFMDRTKEHYVQPGEGQGVLLNSPSAIDSSQLFTKLQHGDIDLQLDFMMPKGSNSGIYLQSRYEVQLFDSWMKDSVSFSDCGGIYQRWQNEKGFEGKAPLSNAAKAPGLWQHLSISFQAPRFDSTGKKISNAVFKEVILNGTVIHKNIEVTGPTRAAAFTDEKPMAPLMIQGDHGAVAFKNIRYKTFENKDSITVSAIRFAVYKGVYKNYDTLKNFQPERTGTSDSITWMVGDRKAQLVLEGNMTIPKDGDYLFKIKSGGPSWLFLDGKEVLDNDSTREYTNAYYSKLSLKAGTHPFKIIYANQDESLVLAYEGPGIAFKTLTTPSSERLVKEIPAFEYVLEGEPAYQRGFFKHHNKINPYTIAVGIPGGMSYAYDLSTYNLLSAWRGNYIDVSNMWTERGETQRALPLGTPVEFSGKPALAKNAGADTWPDTVAVDDNMYSNRSYRIDEKGMPVFHYAYQNAAVEDFLMPTPDKTGLLRKVHITFSGAADQLYFLLASGHDIKILPNGAYGVDDKQYYLEAINGVDTKTIKILDEATGLQNLVVPLKAVQGTSIDFNYSLIW